MRIKILGDNDQTRGKSFELLIKSLLDELGYTDFKTNIRPAAMELDIEATHKTANTKILCSVRGIKILSDRNTLSLFMVNSYMKLVKVMQTRVISFLHLDLHPASTDGSVTLVIAQNKYCFSMVQKKLSIFCKFLTCLEMNKTEFLSESSE